MTVTCEPVAAPLAPGDGVKRHITSPESLAAWGLGFIDVLPVEDGVVGSYEEGAPMAAAPDVARAADGTLWLVELGVRRRLGDGAVAAWKLDVAAARDLAAEEMAAV